MKIEINGNHTKRKVLMDGKDITDHCTSVRIDVIPKELVKVTLTYADVDVEINEEMELSKIQ